MLSTTGAAQHVWLSKANGRVLGQTAAGIQDAGSDAALKGLARRARG